MLITKDVLDELAQSPCACGCGNIPGSELWLHARCHAKAGLTLERSDAGILTLACVRCAYRIGEFAIEKADRDFSKTCHPKAPYWVKYEGGYIKAYCRQCREFINRVKVELRRMLCRRREELHGPKQSEEGS